MVRAPKTANPERREQIIEAAEKVFLRNGLRGASMEAIARAAGVAKPTLYAYFPDKEAVYAEVTARLMEELRGLFVRDLGGPGPAADRVARALVNKHKAVFRLIEGSPHADELLGEDALSAASGEIAAFERWVEGEIAHALSADGHVEPRKYAQLLTACAAGICDKVRFAEQIGPAIRLVTEKLLA